MPYFTASQTIPTTVITVSIVGLETESTISSASAYSPAREAAKPTSLNIVSPNSNGFEIYDSTFLSYSYEEKKNKEFKDIDTFTKLAPSKEELAKCNSRFYNKINS